MDEIQINGAGEEVIGDEFYEKIEAPKFVDLTAPDRCRTESDDRYWFCLRVGEFPFLLFTVFFYFSFMLN